MATGISTFGDIGLSGTFGWENNEIHRKVFLSDPKHQMTAFLEEIFGSATQPTPAVCFDPFGKFYAMKVDFDAIDPRASMGETESAGDFDILQDWPTIRGGVTLDITYVPMDYNGNSDGSGGFQPITDETYDFSAQTMSLIGNNFGTNPSALNWSDGTPLVNLTAITKIIPKIEFVQKNIYCKDLPSETQMNLIGSVNAGGLAIGSEGSSGLNRTWPPGTALLTALPVIRRWRWDGVVLFEIVVKLAFNMYKDTIENGSVDYVTWNRLYRPGKYWDKVKVGTAGVPIYPESDLAQITGSL